MFLRQKMTFGYSMIQCRPLTRRCYLIGNIKPPCNGLGVSGVFVFFYS